MLSSRLTFLSSAIKSEILSPQPREKAIIFPSAFFLVLKIIYSFSRVFPAEQAHRSNENLCCFKRINQTQYDLDHSLSHVS